MARTRKPHQLRMLIAAATMFAVLSALGYWAAAAAGDDGPPITVPTITTPVPPPDPEPQPKPKPVAPAPPPPPARSQPPAPAPVLSQPSGLSNRGGTTTPTRPKPKQRPAARAKPQKPAVTPTKPAKRPVNELPGRRLTNTQASGSSSSSIWPRLFFVSLGVLLVMLALSITPFVRTRRRAALATAGDAQPQATKRRRGKAEWPTVRREKVPRPPTPATAVPAEETRVTTPLPKVEAPAAVPAAPLPQPAPVVATGPSPAPVRPLTSESAASAPETQAEPPAALPQPLPAPIEEPEPVVAQPQVEAMPPAVVQPPPPSAPEESESPEPVHEVCYVTLWRGYAKACFYALLDTDGAQEELAVAESPLFRFRGNGALEKTEAIEAAHRMVVESLLAAGWEQDGPANPWYADRFRRVVTAGSESASPVAQD
jgi:hypothetical protein